MVPNQGYFIQGIPYTIGGIEHYREEEIKVFKTFAWPLQPEEWQLGFWMHSGFSIFIIANEKAFLEGDVETYRQFHQQIRDNCVLLKGIPPSKPLFWEEEARIYQCAAEEK